MICDRWQLLQLNSLEIPPVGYREYDARYEELQGRIDELEASKRERQDRVKRIEIFIRALEKQHGELTEFDDGAWLAVIDTVTVKSDGKLVFRFVNGLEYSNENKA